MQLAVYKDNATGTWRVIYRFTNWKGERKQTQKRGFAKKREALAWEHEIMLKQGAKSKTSELLDLCNEVSSETASVYMEIGLQAGILLMVDIIKNVSGKAEIEVPKG